MKGVFGMLLEEDKRGILLESGTNEIEEIGRAHV